MPDPFDRRELETTAQELARRLWDLRRQRAAHLRAASDDAAARAGVQARRCATWAEFDRLRIRHDAAFGFKTHDAPPEQVVAVLASAIDTARQRAGQAAANLDATAAAIAEHTGIRQRDAAFVFQSPLGVVTAGTAYGVSVRMRNTGSETWTPGAAYRLGSQNPQDNLNWGVGRVDVPGPISPRQEADFNFQVVAPTTPGPPSYVSNLQWRMVQDGVTWFGSHTPNVAVPVQRPVDEVCAGRLNDGRLEVWAVDQNGALFTTWKVTTDPNAGWAPWRDFAGDAGGLGGGARRLAIAPLMDGRLELWAIDGNGGLLTTWKTTTNPDSNWASWYDFFGDVGWLAGGARQVAVAPLSDGRLELWAIDANGGLFTTWQTANSPDSAWAPWNDFAASAGGLPGGARSIGVGRLSDGRLHLWATDAFGALYSTWKLTGHADAGWAPWSHFLT